MLKIPLSDLAEMANVDQRRIKHLADLGAFIPIDEERKVKQPRRYELSEAAIALILAHLQKFDVAAPTLVSVGVSLRELFATPQDLGIELVRQAEARLAEVLFVKTRARHIEKQKTSTDVSAEEINAENSLQKDWPELTAVENKRILDYVIFGQAQLGRPTIMNFGIDGDYWTYWLGFAPLDDKPIAYITLLLHRVLAPLRA